LDRHSELPLRVARELRDRYGFLGRHDGARAGRSRRRRLFG
jgi:hypothetical protein